MKKIPTLFVREFENHGVKSIRPELTSEDLRWVLEGKGAATVKYDGACCAVINGKFYRRYDAKKGKKPPEDAIPCDDPDPVTGHWPHWVPVKDNDPDSKWFLAAKANREAGGEGIPLWNEINVAMGPHFQGLPLADGTYEAVGPHFQGNPYKLEVDTLVPHGLVCISVERTFDGIRDYLEQHKIEGIVFWKDGIPWCKIKRTDFGFEWKGL